MKRALPLVAALVLAVGSGIPLLLVPEPWARGAAAVLLAAIGGIYVGFAFAGESLEAKAIESAQAVACCAIALAGLVGAWAWRAAGLFAHAGWDYAHHRSGALARPPPWYIPFCATYDVVLAVFVLARYLG